ncbi:MAG: M15 family metallopeptidase [Oscillospiraceae bacterium]|nr:M15 family metallopeptidase [Oscillospiraceae bacterium]
MTREEAERLRRARRKKRLRRKRIKAFTLLFLILALIVAVAFFAIKGITSMFGNDSSESTETTITSSDVSSDTDVSTDISSESEEISTSIAESVSDSTVTSETSSTPDINSGESTSSTVPVGEKPAQSWSTMLVNVWNYMPEGYLPEVRNVYNCGADTQKQFDVRAADALEQMLQDARDAGYNMYLVSAYRTYDYQVGLYNRKVSEYIGYGYDEATAKTEAAKWVAIPGTSEHSIGLAADIVSSTWYNYNSDLTEDFEDTEHFEWLYTHCADYGFILRFPKNREATTAISYEPWHYRYVGVEAAKYIMSNNITLEEFCAG